MKKRRRENKKNKNKKQPKIVELCHSTLLQNTRGKAYATETLISSPANRECASDTFQRRFQMEVVSKCKRTINKQREISTNGTLRPPQGSSGRGAFISATLICAEQNVCKWSEKDGGGFSAEDWERKEVLRSERQAEREVMRDQDFTAEVKVNEGGMSYWLQDRIKYMQCHDTIRPLYKLLSADAGRGFLGSPFFSFQFLLFL